MIAILIGLFFFFTGLPMPELFRKCISFLAGLNTPLAMFAVGVYMAQTDLKAMFTKPVLYTGCCSSRSSTLPCCVVSCRHAGYETGLPDCGRLSDRLQHCHVRPAL
ncbi:MAG: hypothetical protein IKD69_05235 [Solobacterium sp.]|nr:hypothetical protein [Solobacterium sp.]